MEEDDGEAGCHQSNFAMACQKLTGKLSALTEKQRELERSLGRLSSEQEDFIKDMRIFADVVQRRDTHAAGGVESREIWRVSPNGRGSRVARTSTMSLLDYMRGQIEERRHSKHSNQSVPKSASSSTLRPMNDDHLASIRCLKSQMSSVLKHSASAEGFSTDNFSLCSRARSASKALLNSRYFDVFIGILILVNAVNIGWAIEAELKNQDTSMQTLIEIIIVVMFWLELALLSFVHGISALKSLWNIFDFMINLVTTVVLVTVSANEAEGSGFAEAMQQMVILRLVRLLRLFRAVRIIQMSKSLWKLVQGLKKCAKTMAAALVLILIVLYVLACFGAEMITKTYTGDSEVGDIIDSRMSSVPGIMLTLFQFISMDSTADIYVSLVQRNPYLIVYFLLVVVTVTIMLMNLITAVIVEDAITTATMDNDLKSQILREKLRSVRPAFGEMFHIMDANGDGLVSVEEILDAITHNIEIPPVIQDVVTPPRMLDLFEIIDQDNSGDLTETEFVDGMSCLALSDVPLETMQILHLLRLLRREVSEVSRLGCNRDYEAPREDVHEPRNVTESFSLVQRENI